MSHFGYVRWWRWKWSRGVTVVVLVVGGTDDSVMGIMVNYKLFSFLTNLSFFLWNRECIFSFDFFFFAFLVANTYPLLCTCLHVYFLLLSWKCPVQQFNMVCGMSSNPNTSSGATYLYNYSTAATTTTEPTATTTSCSPIYY